MPPGRIGRRAVLGGSRLRLVVVLTILLGLVQIFFEDVVLFLATTNDGVSGLLADPVVAVAVPLTIALLMILLLVGGGIAAREDPQRGQRRRDRFDPRLGVDGPDPEADTDSASHSDPGQDSGSGSETSADHDEQ